MEKLVAESLNENYYLRNSDEQFSFQEAGRKMIDAQIKDGWDLDDIKQGLIDLIEDLIEEKY